MTVPEILAYLGIDPEVIRTPFQTNSFPAVTGTMNHDPLSVVDMPFVGKAHSNANSQGWLRSIDRFNRGLYAQKPEAFSPDNIERMKAKNSLIIDNQLSDAFPQYKGFEGEKLIHHHIGGDGQAVGEPESLHVDYGGIHDAEEASGVRENAELFTKFYEDKLAEDPLITREAVTEAYQQEQPFRHGVSYLMNESDYNRYYLNNENETLGRDSNLFVVSSDEMDKILEKSDGDMSNVEKELGLKPGYFPKDEKAYRIDISNSAAYEMTRPTAETPGANEYFTGTGMTSGGHPETVIRDVPTPLFDEKDEKGEPLSTKASCIYDPEAEKAENKAKAPKTAAEDDAATLSQNQPKAEAKKSAAEDDADTLSQNQPKTQAKKSAAEDDAAALSQNQPKAEAKKSAAEEDAATLSQNQPKAEAKKSAAEEDAATLSQNQNPPQESRRSGTTDSSGKPDPGKDSGSGKSGPSDDHGMG